MTEITERLAGFAAGLDLTAVPPEVVERAKMLILDTVGIAVRARHDADSTPAMMQAVGALGLDGGGAASVFADRQGYAPPAAALVNGALAHSLDFDDTHAASSLHPSAPVLPAALAAAEMTGASGAGLLAGVIAGYEVITRISMALGPGDHYERGFHPTATCGAFAAAAAAGRVFGLTAERMASGLGIALSQAAGSLQFLENGAWTKRYQVGAAAMAGLMAATFARAGYVGAAEPIEGRLGFLHGYAPDARPAKAVAGLGEVWETLAIAVKPYPACRFTHASMDAVIALRREHGFRPGEVRRLVCGLPKKGILLTGEPIAHKRAPKNVVDGQFSMPFVAAVGLFRGEMGWDDYATCLKDPEVMAACGRVEVEHDPEAEAAYPDRLAGSATVVLADGRELRRFVGAPKGEPENFVTPEELRAKFRALVRPYVGEAGEAALFRAVMGLEDGGAAELFRHAAPPEAVAAAGED
ncbi:MAG TPA: MmgE/PrpD family protein [Geminicoccaceae bacterium]|nr:MmgE/PrpD family protein [Geminicoccaceae bacterium]